MIEFYIRARRSPADDFRTGTLTLEGGPAELSIPLDGIEHEVVDGALVVRVTDPKRHVIVELRELAAPTEDEAGAPATPARDAKRAIPPARAIRPGSGRPSGPAAG